MAGGLPAGGCLEEKTPQKTGFLSIHFFKNYDSLLPRELWLKLLESSQLHLGVGSLLGMESGCLPEGGHELD